LSSFGRRARLINVSAARRAVATRIATECPNRKVRAIWNVCHFFPFSQDVADANLLREWLTRAELGPMVATTSRSDRDFDAEAEEALEAARAMPAGTAKSEAMKKAGLLRKAADAQATSYAKRGRPPK